MLARHGRRGVYYGHFGDGCLHVRIDFDLASRAGIANFRAFLEDAADLAVAHGGSLSGEHGDGAAAPSCCRGCTRRRSSGRSRSSRASGIPTAG